MGENKMQSSGPYGGTSMGGGASNNSGAKKQQEMKLVLIGRQGVGKSCLMMQYISHCFEENHEPTFVEETSFTQRVVDGQPWRLQIIDTAGQEEFQYLVEQYFQSGHGFLAVFDLCNRESLEELQSVFKRVARSKDLLDEPSMHMHVPCVIVGNKNDLPSDLWQVTLEEEVHTFVRQYEFPFFQTSAKTPYNVEEAFECLIRETARKVFKTNSDSEKDGCGGSKGSKRKSKDHKGNQNKPQCVIS